MSRLSLLLALTLAGVARATTMTCPSMGEAADGMAGMLANWGWPMRVTVGIMNGVADTRRFNVFTLGLSCYDDVFGVEEWYECPVTADSGGAVQIPGVPGPAVCTAYAYQYCRANVQVAGDSGLEIRNRSQWTVAPATATLPGRTQDAIPGARVFANVSHSLTRGNSSTADATLRGIRVACGAPAGHSCIVSIDLPSAVVPGTVLDAEIAGGTSVTLPPTAFAVVAGDFVGVSAIDLLAAVSCKNGASGDLYPATQPRVTLTVPVAPIYPPSGSVASVQVGGRWAAPACDAPSCTAFVPGVPLGPFSSLGVQPVHVPATLGVRNSWDNQTTTPFTAAVDASFDSTVVVSDVGCVHSSADWAAIADATPELVAFLPFPVDIIPGIVSVQSPRQLSRLLWEASNSDLIDALRAELVAARMTLSSGVPCGSREFPKAYRSALGVLSDCPTGDPLVWANVKFGFTTCAGLDDSNITTLVGTFSIYNAGLGGMPSCSTSG
jgi:hypothetical protein